MRNVHLPCTNIARLALPADSGMLPACAAPVLPRFAGWPLLLALAAGAAGRRPAAGGRRAAAARAPPVPEGQRAVAGRRATAWPTTFTASAPALATATRWRAACGSTCGSTWWTPPPASRPTPAPACATCAEVETFADVLARPELQAAHRHPAGSLRRARRPGRCSCSTGARAGAVGIALRAAVGRPLLPVRVARAGGRARGPAGRRRWWTRRRGWNRRCACWTSGSVPKSSSERRRGRRRAVAVVNARGRARVLARHPWIFRQDVVRGPATDAARRRPGAGAGGGPARPAAGRWPPGRRGPRSPCACSRSAGEAARDERRRCPAVDAGRPRGWAPRAGPAGRAGARARRLPGGARRERRPARAVRRSLRRRRWWCRPRRWRWTPPEPRLAPLAAASGWARGWWSRATTDRPATSRSCPGAAGVLAGDGPTRGALPPGPQPAGGRSAGRRQDRRLPRPGRQPRRGGGAGPARAPARWTPSPTTAASPWRWPAGAAPCWPPTRTPRAVERARANAARNGLANLEVRRANAFDLLRQLEADGKRFDVVVVDPPALAKRKSEAGAAERAYKELVLRGAAPDRHRRADRRLLLLGAHQPRALGRARGRGRRRRRPPGAGAGPPGRRPRSPRAGRACPRPATSSAGSCACCDRCMRFRASRSGPACVCGQRSLGGAAIGVMRTYLERTEVGVSMISEENVKMGNKALVDEVEPLVGSDRSARCSGWWIRCT